jgi:hypothetical protein
MLRSNYGKISLGCNCSMLSKTKHVDWLELGGALPPPHPSTLQNLPNEYSYTYRSRLASATIQFSLKIWGQIRIALDEKKTLISLDLYNSFWFSQSIDFREPTRWWLSLNQHRPPWSSISLSSQRWNHTEIHTDTYIYILSVDKSISKRSCSIKS